MEIYCWRSSNGIFCRFGQNTLVQFEDFASRNAHRLLQKFKNRYTTFNDDIQGTASVVVAGLLACNKVTGKSLSEQKYVFFGAGGASTGIAELCVREMEMNGMSVEKACDRFYLMDIDGLITKSRPNINPQHVKFAKNIPPTKSLIEVIRKVQPQVLIGASTVHGAFTEEVLRAMAEYNPHPIVFALSNPTDKSECTASEAYQFTNGTVLFASGSPFPDVYFNGNVYKPGQGNNAYIFPGIALGTILFQIRHINNDLFLLAAKTVASCVTEESLQIGRIYPCLNDIREISIKIAIEIANYCYKKGIANLYPQPEDLDQYVRTQVYHTEYETLVNRTYDWPAQDMRHGFPVPVDPCDDVDDN
ncbi:unnamed protein product [Toxocara canis]|uniref:Malic_M domain-containing protein n=1 Tax=Toxocara canis TaxID=6265 RepID=A0A183VFC3_TOXCA|nr:unnamed protein product [Toxocara canis]